MPTTSSATTTVVDVATLPQPFSVVRGTYRGLQLTLEDKVVLALLELGWQVALLTPRERHLLTETLIVRQWCPRVMDVRTGKRRAYRLDFAHPLTKVALEVDGYNRLTAAGRRNGKGGHITWAGFHADRERDRNLTLGGWRVLRCGPDDLKTPAGALEIAREFARLINQVANSRPEGTHAT